MFKIHCGKFPRTLAAGLVQTQEDPTLLLQMRKQFMNKTKRYTREVWVKILCCCPLQRLGFTIKQSLIFFYALFYWCIQETCVCQGGYNERGKSNHTNLTFCNLSFQSSQFPSLLNITKHFMTSKCVSHFFLLSVSGCHFSFRNYPVVFIQ